MEASLELAVVQLSSGGHVAQNLEACAKLVAAAARRGAQVVVLPEYFAYFGPDSGRCQHAERLGDTGAPIQSAVARMARDNGCHVVAGGMPIESTDPERPYNAAAVFDPSGALLGTYDKIHLSNVDLADGTSLRESASTMPGAEPRTMSLAGFEFGLSICYDLRFPELYRKLMRAGAEVLLVPAAFTLHTGKDHWHTLLRARAIENQCYVAAAGQWGSHAGGPTTYGHSLIADPWGSVIAECSDGVGFTLATLLRSRIESLRRSLPCLTHARLSG
jgi:predicted amidohydrolase